MKHNIIAVIGAPRSGKSFLVSKLAPMIGAHLFLEGQNDSFPGFIEEDIKQNQNAMRRIIWFRNRQIDSFLKAVDLKNSGKSVLLDTFWVDYHPYIDVLLTGNDKDVALEMATLDLKTLVWPDMIIYLKNDEQGTKRFLMAGDRDFDKGDFYRDTIIPLQAAYQRVSVSVPSSTKFFELDRSAMDFENDQDIQMIIEKINS